MLRFWAKDGPWAKISDQNERVPAPFSVVHTGICGPIQFPCIARARYFITINDSHNSGITNFSLQNEWGVKSFCMGYKRMAEWQASRSVRALPIDTGGEHLNAMLEEHFCSLEAPKQVSTAPSLHQNGVSEHMNWTIQSLLRVELQRMTLARCWLAEAFSTVTYIWNRVGCPPIQLIKLLIMVRTSAPVLGHHCVFQFKVLVWKICKHWKEGR